MSAGPHEPRPGFFARLFGRRRKDPAPTTTPHAAAQESLEPPVEDVAPEPPAAESPDQQPFGVTVRQAPAATLDAPPPEPGIAWRPEAETDPEPEPVGDRPTLTAAPTAEHIDLAAGTAAATDGNALPDTSPPTATADSDEQPAINPPGASAGMAEPAPTAEDGLAAELRAAEEVAASEVEAVLTNVLDRLGAAHHRPFSRA